MPQELALEVHELPSLEAHGGGLPHEVASLFVIGDRYEQAHAYDGLAATYDVAGNSDEALVHWERALHIYTSLGTADADAVRASMRRLSPGPRVNAGWNGVPVAEDVL